jgi:hypothetical protein
MEEFFYAPTVRKLRGISKDRWTKSIGRPFHNAKYLSGVLEVPRWSQRLARKFT